MAEAGSDEKNPSFRILRKVVERREFIHAGNLSPCKCGHQCLLTKIPNARGVENTQKVLDRCYTEIAGQSDKDIQRKFYEMIEHAHIGVTASGKAIIHYIFNLLII